MTQQTAGYSGTPLPKKLGLKEGQRVLLDAAPDGFSLGGQAPPGLRVVRRASSGSCDVVLAFVTSRSALVERADRLIGKIPRTGTLWICWPKRASGVPSDMTEDVVRDVFLPRGLVDVKVCAIDVVWSGLKVVWRLEHR